MFIMKCGKNINVDKNRSIGYVKSIFDDYVIISSNSVNINIFIIN